MKPACDGPFFLRWVLWSLLYALVLGGKPWRFPAGGAYWLASFSPEPAATATVQPDASPGTGR